MRLHRRLPALLMAVVLLISLFPAAAAEERVVTIADREDFFTFSKDCTRDVWSQGLRVELTADLDLGGVSFQPIPIFQGTFRGNGHTIRGISFGGKGSSVGLFRTLTETAVVEDLTVEGLLFPDGSASQVGLLAGENRGTIRRCTTQGTVSAQEDVGGIVGVNRESGVIENCINQAEVTGVLNAGGIAGQNLGLITNCSNTGALDPAADQEIPTSVGGIAGLSRGTIRECENSGAIGYPHLGYNMGGIAGMQSGNITRCSNTGAVWGRKDVGGITGQFEPNTSVTYGPSPMDRLNDSLAALFGQMEVFTEQVDAIADRGVADARVIHDALSSIQDRTYQAGTEGREDFKAMSDQLYGYSNDISTALDVLRDRLEVFSDTSSEDLNEILDQCDRFTGSLSSMLEEADEGLGKAIGELDDAASSIRDESEAIRRALSQMSQELDDLERYIRDVTGMIAAGDFEGALQLPFPDLDPRGHMEAIAAALEAIPSQVAQLTRQWDKIYQKTSGRIEEDQEDADRALRRLNDAAVHLVDIGNELSHQVSYDLSMVSQGADDIRSLLKSYTDQLSDKVQSAVDDIDAQMTVIQDQVDQMTQDADKDSEALHATSLEMIHLLDQVRQAIYDLGKKPQLTVDELTDVTEGPGLITGCTAACTVNGDSNAGGIVGTVSTELGDDPEATFDLDSIELLADTYATLRAVVRDSRFDGSVVAKNDCGGGIIGRAEAGAIVDCAARGAVETGTDYCGGIAGRTKAVVLRCASLVDLTGGSWLGGIAGLGDDLTDCRSMVRASGDGEYWGAIAGQADGQLSGNRYLMEDLAGLDGVDYAETAQGLDFAAFSQLDHIPQDFLVFSYRFTVDGQTVAEVPFTYGGDLDEALIPAAPERDGQYGQWPYFPTHSLTRSLVLEAQFAAPTSTLSAGGEIPTLLAQGTFSPDARLTFSEAQLPQKAVSGYAPLSAWTYTVTGSKEDTVTLRLRAEGAEHPTAAILQDGKWTLADSVQDGSYLVFQAPAEGQVLLLDQKVLPAAAIILCGGGAALLLLILLLFRRHRRKQGAAACP